ncbi:hypothetical protein BH10BAC2_BH10BAC2_01070 [soil metagenome]
MKWMITCMEATNFISLKEEGKLSLKQYIQLWLHLGICSLCKLFYRQNKIITKSTGKLHEHTTAKLSAAQKETIISKMKEAE